jgi:large subunit ribosomal protein L1
MVLTKDKFVKAIDELRKAEAAKHKQRGFDQTVDLIVNLKEFSLKKNPLNLLMTLPHKVKDKKIAGFLEKKSGEVDTITKEEFVDYKDKKKLKSLVDKYDFFIANAKLMPAVATTFGRTLGPSGKMPSPQMGVLIKEDDASIKDLILKIDSVIKVRPKETSVKISIGKQSLKDEEIAENAYRVYSEIFKNLPRNKENLKNVLIKFTMSKPVHIDF